jgi:hypothetical protein
MKWHAKRLSLAAVGIVTAAATTACGDNVTGPVTWHSTVLEVVRHAPAGPNTEVVYDTLTGPLTDSTGHGIAGTLFRESCNQKYVGNVLVQNWNCTAVVNTGPQLYVAGGRANGNTGELAPLNDPRFGGAFFISVVGTPPATPATAPFSVQIVVEPGGRAPVIAG